MSAEPEEDEAGAAWESGIAEEWADELNDLGRISTRSKTVPAPVPARDPERLAL